MSINPDAHSIDEIDLTHWGVEMARNGGVPKEWVLNCLDLPRFAAFLAERLRHAANGPAPLTKLCDARPLGNAHASKAGTRREKALSKLADEPATKAKKRPR